MKAETALFAREFWARVGEVGPFPRNIERAITLALPVVIVKLPRLTVDLLASWLRRRGVSVQVPPCDGEMAGCVVAHRGHAVIFVCGADPDEEVRATIAHELAHLLLHYLAPRERAVRLLGNRLVEVLDGDREASFAERARGLLQNVGVGLHVHVLPREENDSVVEQVEREADDLALELAAPRKDVVEFLERAATGNLSPRRLREALATQFGLPVGWFRAVVPERRAQPADRLGSILTRLGRAT